MQQLNLLPDIKLEKRKQERYTQISIVIFITTVVVVVMTSLGLVGLTVTQAQQNDQQLQRYEDAKQEEENLDMYGVDVTDVVTGTISKVHIRSAGKILQQQLSSVNGLLKNRLYWKPLLELLAKNTPEGVTLGSLSVNQNKVDLKGTATDYSAITKFSTSLASYHGDLVRAALDRGVLTIDENGQIVMTIDEQISVLGVDAASATDFLKNNPDLNTQLLAQFKAEGGEITPLLTAIELGAVTEQKGQFNFTLKFVAANQVFYEITQP